MSYSCLYLQELSKCLRNGYRLRTECTVCSPWLKLGRCGSKPVKENLEIDHRGLACPDKLHFTRFQYSVIKYF